jgi:hypothetical protein
MNNYEIFTENFSQVVQAHSISQAMNFFFWEHMYKKGGVKIIAIVDCAYPEFLENPNDKLRRDIHRLGQLPSCGE